MGTLKLQSTVIQQYGD